MPCCACRQQAENLTRFSLFVDAGWFLDMQPYANRSDGMTFHGCARAIADVFHGTFDRHEFEQGILGHHHTLHHLHNTIVSSLLFPACMLPLSMLSCTAYQKACNAGMLALLSTGVVVMLCSSCEAAQAPGQAWRCFFAQQLWPYLSTPTLFHEYLYDSANLGYDGAAWRQYDDFREKLQSSFLAWEDGDGGCPAGAAWVPGDRTSSAGACTSGKDGEQGEGEGSTVVSRQQLPGNATAGSGSRRPNVFSPACHLHEMIDSVQFTTSHVGEQHLTDVLAGWFDGGISRVFLLDNATYVRGSDECGVDPAAAKQMSDVLSYTQN